MRLFLLGLAVFFLNSDLAFAELCVDEASSGLEPGVTAKPHSGLSCIIGGIKDMVVEDAYTYPTSPQQKNGAVFMTIKNTGDTDIRIVAAESDIAEKVELHTHMMDGDMMMMREVEGFDIPAQSEIRLEPTGHHIMLMGLNKQLVQDEGFVMRLRAADGQSYVLNVFPSFGDKTP